MNQLQTKFQSLIAGLKGEFFERGEIVEGLVTAALAGEHVLLVGPPGTAKSALVSAFTRAINGANYFEWLLGSFTVPEELYGPMSLVALNQERFRRVTTGKLPEAHVAFLDEIFKAKGPILNTLLPLLNERKFYNDGAPTLVPTRMVVGASNELPDGAELGALYDRFLVRFQVGYLQGTETWLDMVESKFSANGCAVDLTEWDAARVEVDAVQMTRAMAELVHKLREQLRTDLGLQISDRRWRQSVKLLRAAAWLSGETEVMEEHMATLAPALWDEPTQIARVKEKCVALAGSTANESAKVTEQVEQLIAALPQINGKPTPDEQTQMVTAQRESNRAMARLQELKNQARTDRARKVAEDAIKKVETLMNPVRQTLRLSLGL